MKNGLTGMASLVAAMLLAHAAPAAAQDAAPPPSKCELQRAALDARTAQISDSYNARFTQLSQRTEAQAKDIEDDAPEPNAAEAVLKFDIEIDSRRQDFALDLPQVTMKPQTFALNLPETKMGRQSWKYKIPAVRMKLRCIDGPPEVVCEWKVRSIGMGIKTKVWTCKTRRGKQICTDIPETYMQEVETVLDLPQLTMVRRDFRTNIPEVTMKTTKLSFNVPTITLKNLRTELRELEDRGNALGEQTKADSEALAQSMEAEIAKANADAMADQYACNRAELEAQRDEKLGEIDAMIQVATAARDKAAEVGAKDMAASNEKVLADLVAARAAFSTQMEDALAKLTSGEETKLEAALPA